MRLSRRGWNNVIIIGCVVFMAAFQLPELFRERFRQNADSSDVTQQPTSPSSDVAHLLKGSPITAIDFPQLSLHANADEWLLDWQDEQGELLIAPHSLINRWQQLQGTTVSSALREQLALPDPVAVTIHQAQQITQIQVYAMPQFWLLVADSGVTIAVSVEASYLFPYQLNRNE